MARHFAAGAAFAAVLAFTAAAQAAGNTPDPDPEDRRATLQGLWPLATRASEAITYRRGDGVLEIRVRLQHGLPPGHARLRCLGGGGAGPVVAVLGRLAGVGRSADGALYGSAILRREDVIATDGSSGACPYVIESLDDLSGAIEFGDIRMDLQPAR